MLSAGLREDRSARTPAVAKKQTLKVEVPSPSADRPRLGRVGIVAGMGFAIGIAWPWLAGVQLVPSAPVEAPLRAPAASASAALAAPQPSDEDPAEPKPPSNADRIKVGDRTVTSCRAKNGDRVDQCDAIEFDASAKPRILALVGCPAFENANGILSLGLDLDFERNQVTRIQSGASTTLAEATAEGLVRCAKKEFASASLDGIQHQHATYKVFYRVEFLPPGKSASESEAEEPTDEITPASGMATVSWNVAIVRDGPNTDAERVARLRSGTRVVVVGRRNDWYKVKYDAEGSEGWVYKGAIGL